MLDLTLVVADKNMQFALKGALGRPEALGIRPIQCQFLSAGNDGVARTQGPDLLRTQQGISTKGLLILDYEGSGTNKPDARSLEEELNSSLQQCWPDGAKAIVIEPELEMWLWGSDNALQNALEWPLSFGIRNWLEHRIPPYTFRNNGKPDRPKEAWEALIPVHRKPRSSSLYEEVASQISLKNCIDPSFVRLRQHLQMWFPM